MSIKKAVIPVAGLGTRFLPATKSIPKEMFPIVDKPSIQYIVEEAISSGIEQIIFINAHGKEAIEDHFDKNIELETILASRNQKDLLNQVQTLTNMASIVTVRQKTPLGLGHAILCAKEVVGNEPFAVMLGDDLVDAEKPCLSQLIDVYKRERSSVIALMDVPDNQTHLYGIAEVNVRNHEPRAYDLKSVVEKPTPGQAPSNLAIIGRYLLPPKVFEYLETTTPGSGGEIQLTDAIQHLLSDEGVIGYRYEGQRFDVGDKLGFLHANLYYGMKRPEFRDSLKNHLKELES